MNLWSKEILGSKAGRMLNLGKHTEPFWTILDIWYLVFPMFTWCVSLQNLLKVQGGFLVDPAPLDLRVLNSADFFLHVRAKVISGPSGMSGTLDLQVVGNIQPYKVCPSIPPKMAQNSHVS